MFFYYFYHKDLKAGSNDNLDSQNFILIISKLGVSPNFSKVEKNHVKIIVKQMPDLY